MVLEECPGLHLAQRGSIFLQHHQLAVQDCAGGQKFQVGQLGELESNLGPMATLQPDVTALDERHAPGAVPLDFKQTLLRIEGRFSALRQHGFDNSRLHFASGKWPLSKRGSLERRNSWSPNDGNLNSVHGQIEPEASGC
jgi:hypothetical protein